MDTRACGIEGVTIGHWTDPEGLTGCTAVLLPDGTTASREVRGGAPATRDLDALAPDKAVTTADAVLLTGGSAFGLRAADGVMTFLEERGRGVATPAGVVPIVPTLALFDLAVGDASARPTPEAGRAAASVAAATFEVGEVGAGAGARTSQWRGPDGRRTGGLRYAEHRLGDLVVGAVCAVNAFGDVDDGTAPPAFDAVALLQQGAGFGDAGRTHTTIGVVVTNARLDKIGCFLVAQGAHDGLSRALTQPHTRFDGDAFVAAATGEVEAHVDVVRLLALAAVTDAIRSAGR